MHGSRHGKEGDKTKNYFSIRKALNVATNVSLTSTVYSQLVLMQLGDKLKVTRNMSKDFAKEFGKDPKIGGTYNVRKPQRFVGADLSTSDLTYSAEAIDNRSTSISIDKVAHVSFEMNAWEKTISLADAYKLTEPAAIALANKINGAAAKYIALNTFNMVGTPGTAPTTMLPYLNAEDKLVQLGMPENSKLTCIVNRKMSSAFVNGTNALYNNSAIVGKQHETGRVVNQLGYEWLIDQTIFTLATGAQGGTIVVDGATRHQAGGNNANGTINLKGITATTLFAKAGDNLTLAGVFSVHPQTRVSTGDLAQFTVLADATSDGAGKCAVSIYPAISDATIDAQYQNVSATAGDGAAVVINGGGSYASKSSPQGLLLHPDAFAFVSIPFVDENAPSAQVSQTVDPDTGIALNVTRWFDGNNLKSKTRLDVAYGFGRLYPELACRIAG